MKTKKNAIEKNTFGKNTILNVERFPILVTYRKDPTKETQLRVPFFWNVYTGKKSFNIEDVKEEGKSYQVIDKTNSCMYGVSIQYDESKDMIAFILCELDASCEAKNKQETPRSWKATEYAYYTKDKKLWVKQPLWTFYKYRNSAQRLIGEQACVETSFGLTEVFSCHLPKRCVLINSPRMISDGEDNKYWYQYDLMKPFRDWFGEIVPISGNKMIVLDCVEALNIFSKYKTPSNSAKTQKSQRLNELLEYSLPDVQIPDNFKELNTVHNWLARTYNAANENIHRFAVIQRVNEAPEPLCVVRTFYKSPYGDTVMEAGRIYVSKTEVLSCKKLDKDTFMYQKLLDKPENWNFPIETFDKDEVKGTKLAYFGEVLDEIGYELRGIVIWSFLKEPCTEILYKMPEMKEFMQNIFKLSVTTSPIQILDDVFFKINKGEKNGYKILGLNKHQLGKILPVVKKYMPIFSIYAYYNGYVLPAKALKQFLSPSVPVQDGEHINISCIDEETSDWTISLVEKIFKNYGRKNSLKTAVKNGILTDWEDVRYDWVKVEKLNALFDCFLTTINTYNISMAKKMEELIFKFFNNDILIEERYYWGIGTRSVRFAYIYNDTLRMISQCELTSKIKPYFSTMEELQSMHDLMVETLNAKKDQYELKQWERRKDFWKKWEFEDEKMSAIIPEKPSALATEGITLRHCVRSYIGRVAKGETNIMFIRLNDELEKPFYTVEIDNNSIIQQVHGMCNCNATDEVKTFVRKWCKAKHLKTDTFNKVR